MIEKLKKINDEIGIFDVNGDEFLSYGRVIKDLDVSDIIEEAKKIEYPESGAAYIASVGNFEKLRTGRIIQNEFFGTLPTQVGYCFGHNTLLNATEWHTSSEINIAVTPVVLILGHVWEVEDNKIDSSKFKAFYLPAGTTVEVYATSLHYTPCEVMSEGFGCVVGLPLDTNTELTEKVENPLLYCRNKWLLSHVDNSELTEKGVFPGITGRNIEIKY